MALTGQPDSIECRRLLLQLARRAASIALGERAEQVGTLPLLPKRVGGVFVTFWRGHALRGCMGTFSPQPDLASTIEEVTRLSIRDPRFASQPITAAELAELEIEISLLTAPYPAGDPRLLVVGRHGIVIRQGGRSGCFLPKVALDRGWTAEEFLSECCKMKAGLPADAWRSPDAEVLFFEADAFRETDFA